MARFKVSPGIPLLWAPHSAIPHPNFVPVISSTSRITLYGAHGREPDPVLHHHHRLAVLKLLCHSWLLRCHVDHLIFVAVLGIVVWIPVELEGVDSRDVDRVHVLDDIERYAGFLQLG